MSHSVAAAMRLRKRMWCALGASPCHSRRRDSSTNQKQQKDRIRFAMVVASSASMRSTAPDALSAFKRSSTCIPTFDGAVSSSGLSSNGVFKAPQKHGLHA